MGQFTAVLGNTYVQYGILLASTYASVAASRRAAGAQEVELGLAQRKETDAARDREIQRKQRIKALLGTQAAEAASRGIQMAGSVANISLVDAGRAADESMIDRITTRGRIDALSRKRKTISSLSRFRTATTIMGAAERAGEIG